MQPPTPITTNRSLVSVLVFASLIVCVAMGIRHTFGLFMTPMTTDLGWTRENFSIAVAMQNLLWGLCQPFAGLAADRFGARRVLWAGSALYVLGLIGMAWSTTGTGFIASQGMLVGIAQSGVTYAVVYSAMGKLVPAAKRGWAMGIVAAAGSFGQFLMVPVTGGLINGLGWFGTLLVLAVIAATIVPLGSALTRGLTAIPAATHGQSAKEAFSQALADRSFVLLTLGYFVCGFQLIFIAVHLPTYLIDKGLSGNIGMTALALIGLFNVFGTYFAGYLGERFPKHYLLSAIYFSRSLAIALFMLVPLSPLSVYVFAAMMGFTWLGTVPLTSSIIAQVFGVRFLGMLSGFVFFSHQVGSFLGAWLGGWVFDRTGSYDIVWGVCIALGIVSALLNLPINETSLASRRLQPANV